MVDDPQQLLAGTRALTRQVRHAQRGSWFPLLVFGAVTLAAVPFYRYGPHPLHCSGAGQGGRVCIVEPTLALWYWPLAALGAYLAISWFYRRRSLQRGVGTRIGPYVVIGVALTIAVTLWAFWANSHPAFFAQTRLAPGQPGGDLLDRIASPAGVIGIALLGLAWLERSWRLSTLAVAYLIAAETTAGVAWYGHPSPWAALPHLLIDGAVLLLGSLLVAVPLRSSTS